MRNHRGFFAELRGHMVVGSLGSLFKAQHLFVLMRSDIYHNLHYDVEFHLMS